MTIKKRLEFSLPALPAPKSTNYGFVQNEWGRYLTPVSVHSTTGDVSGAEALLSADPGTFATLTKRSTESVCPSVILDYGVAVAGIPVIRVHVIDSTSTTKRLAARALLDFSVSEGYPGILQPDGDGPYPFSAGADTSRRVRFRLKRTGLHEARCVQGSQRWLRLALVGPGTCQVCVSLAGFVPTTSNAPLDGLPGYFQCADETLTRLWAYGARTLQLNSVPVRAVPAPWEVSADMGVLIDGQRCNAYGWGDQWTDYRVRFDGMILDGGLAWTVRVPPGRPSILFQLNLDDDDHARLEQWFGYYNTSQVTLEPKLVDSVDLSALPGFAALQFRSGQWFTVETICQGEERVQVRISGVDVGRFHPGGGQTGFPLWRKGSVGIGAGRDQVCRFRDLCVTSMLDGQVLYESGLDNPAVLSDFGIRPNAFPWISDGAKRDRYPWTADIIVGGRALYYSTAGIEYVRGNIVASMMRDVGSAGRLLSGGCPPGRDPCRGDGPDGFFSVLTGNYSLYLVLVIYDFWMYTGDDSLVCLCWGRIKDCLAFLEENVNEGLLSLYGNDAGDYDYYNGLQEGVSTKRNALYVAVLRACAHMALSRSVADVAAHDLYLAQAARTAAAIDASCFNAQTGHYNITDTRTTGFQQEAHAWLVLEDLIPAARLAPVLSQFPLLGQGTHNGAPLSFSPDTPSVPPVISPIMSAMHMQAAIHAGRYAEADSVLRSVWAPMVDEASPHFTGTTWEFLNGQDGTPFKGHFCSYAQLFSVGPTWLLSRYVLGVEPREPGYARYVVHPRWRPQGVRWAQGRVPTPVGDVITVRWEEGEAGWRLFCRGPRGLAGTVVVPESVWGRREGVEKNGAVWEGGREVEVCMGHEVDISVFFRQS